MLIELIYSSNLNLQSQNKMKNFNKLTHLHNNQPLIAGRWSKNTGQSLVLNIFQNNGEMA